MMNQQVLEGHWNELKGQLQERWSQLTDDDLRRAEGNANQLVGIIQQKTGQARERIEAQLDELLSGRASAISGAADKVRDMVQHSSDRVQQGYEQVSERVREGYGQAQATVQQRPMESVAIAFGAGLITGVIVGLVMRSR